MSQKQLRPVYVPRPKDGGVTNSKAIVFPEDRSISPYQFAGGGKRVLRKPISDNYGG